MTTVDTITLKIGGKSGRFTYLGLADRGADTIVLHKIHLKNEVHEAEVKAAEEVKKVLLLSGQRVCPRCEGSGRINDWEVGEVWICARCRGTGILQSKPKKAKSSLKTRRRKPNGIPTANEVRNMLPPKGNLWRYGENFESLKTHRRNPKR